MTDACTTAREEVWEAIKAAGGPYKVARLAGVQVTQLYGWRKRARGIGEDGMAELRRLLPAVSSATWGDACVPPPVPESTDAAT